MTTLKLTTEEQEFITVHTYVRGHKSILAYKPEDEKMIEGIIKKCPELKDRLIKIDNKIY